MGTEMSMRIDILTIFPGIFKGPLNEAMIFQAQKKGLVEFHLHDLRDFTFDRHRTVDDTPFGGGPGMVMKPEPFFRAMEAIRGEGHNPDRVLLMTPQGRLFDQDMAWELSRCRHLVFMCGRYEGVDERVAMGLATDEVSIGDYVLGGGELPALVVIDAIVRLVPGVLGDAASVHQDSFSDGLLEGPQYTRPREYAGMAVPEVLLSGNHQEISRWRRRQALLRTWQRRPDLLEKAKLSPEDLEVLDQIRRQEGEEI